MDKIVCLGKNYSEHAKEMGGPMPEKPVIFIKPPSSLISATQENKDQKNSKAVKWDPLWEMIHHELEVVIKIKKEAYQLAPEEKGENYCESFTLGLDLTKRALQGQLKKNGHPWTVAKVFPGAAIVGPWRDISEISRFRSQEFRLEVNGGLRQKGTMQEMNLSLFDCVSYVSHFFPLCPGDLIFTGTPAGVDEIRAGDVSCLSWGELKFWVNWALF